MKQENDKVSEFKDFLFQKSSSPHGEGIGQCPHVEDKRAPAAKEMELLANVWSLFERKQDDS